MLASPDVAYLLSFSVVRIIAHIFCIPPPNSTISISISGRWISRYRDDVYIDTGLRCISISFDAYARVWFDLVRLGLVLVGLVWFGLVRFDLAWLGLFGV